jgi:molecular chaperone HscB
LSDGVIVDIKSNYFELFQLPLAYLIDQKALTASYRQLQREAHPDRFAGGSDQEKRLAVQYSTYINEAYNCLRSAVLRAEYLLSLQGVERDASQTIKNDPMFLMQQMDWREKLELIAAKLDESELLRFKDQVEEEQQKMIALLSAVIADEKHEKALVLVGKLQFIEKLLLEIDEIEERLLD